MGIVLQDDVDAVSFVARLLDISEFNLFEIAYINWFGNEATKKAMDDFFGSYLTSGLVPFWLRDMVRKVIGKYKKGELTPSEFGIRQPCVNRFKKGFGWILVGLFSFLIFAIVWISSTLKPI
jgi:hypothetical protein